MSTASRDHRFGKSINVVSFGDDNKLIVDYDALDQVFLHPMVKNRKVVVFSVIGAFRKGKSFFLGYCLRFLYATYRSVANPNFKANPEEHWTGDQNEPLKGFSWRSGADRDTTGITIWSDVFLHTDETTGEEIAIVLMDTQGLFDNQTSTADNTRIFALGSLISSIQVLNLFGVIQEDQLQYLQFATAYARFASKDNPNSACKTFQNLVFLVRDWNYPGDYKFGTKGGNNYLQNNILKQHDGQKQELKDVRQFIFSSFDKISCSLLPYPGKFVARTSEYDGNWGQMDPEFKEEFEKTIEELLCPANLTVKRIDSKNLNGSEVKEFIVTFLELFQSDELPPTQTIYESTIEKQMMLLIEKCSRSYKEKIDESRDIMKKNNLHDFHQRNKSKAVTIFKNERKMGSAKDADKYEKLLGTILDDHYETWSQEVIENILRQEEINRLEEEKREAERLAKKRLEELLIEKQKEIERLEAEKKEAERIAKRKLEKLEIKKQKETKRLEEEKKEAERIAKEKLEELEIENQKEIERLEAEKSEAERIAKEKLEELEIESQKEIKRLEDEKKETEIKLAVEEERANSNRIGQILGATSSIIGTVAQTAIHLLHPASPLSLFRLGRLGFR